MLVKANALVVKGKHMNIVSKCVLRVMQREPDEVVGGRENPYLKRWFLIKKGWINLYLHQFLRSDDDRALHDHPGDNISMLLDGQYIVWMPSHPDYGNNAYTFRIRKTGFPIFRRAEQLHRIELMKKVIRDESDQPIFENDKAKTVELPVISLFWRFKHRREWGFKSKKGWIPWFEFCAPDGSDVVGRGCD